MIRVQWRKMPLMIEEIRRALANLKRLLLGNFLAVSSKWLQKDRHELVYQCNRIFREPQLLQHLLNLCALHPPLRTKSTIVKSAKNIDRGIRDN